MVRAKRVTTNWPLFKVYFDPCENVFCQVSSPRGPYPLQSLCLKALKLWFGYTSPNKGLSREPKKHVFFTQAPFISQFLKAKLKLLRKTKVLKQAEPIDGGARAHMHQSERVSKLSSELISVESLQLKRKHQSSLAA